MKQVILCCLLVSLLASLSCAHKCMHDEIMHRNPELRRPRISPQRYHISKSELSRMSTEQQQTQYQPIRITFIYDTLIAENTLTASQLSELQNNFFPQLRVQAANLLSVIPVSGNLRMQVSTCGANGGVTVASSYRTTGIANTDLAIFVTARQESTSAIAWAVSCQIDQNGRPVAGQINIIPSAFFSTSNSVKTREGTVLHELMHVLGFSSNLFSSYRDENNVLRTSVTSSTPNTVNGVTMTINKLVTPNVLKAAREHFNCPTLDGAELEEFGGSGTAGSHWEARMFMDDIMIGSAMWDTVGDGSYYISPMTLGVFQDSGWYRANFTAARRPVWLRNFGCRAAQRCNTWGSSATTGYFGLSCSEYYTSQSSYTLQCNYNHVAKGICNTVAYQTNLSPYYQYFTNTRVGGSVSYMDYCPFVNQFSNLNCRNSANSVSNVVAQTGEFYGTNSRCFVSNVIGNSYPSQSMSARCYETRCASDNKLYVRVGSSNWYPCPVDGGTITGISGYSGSISCPKYFIICDNSTSYQTAPPAPPSAKSSGGFNPWILFGSAPQQSKFSSNLVMFVCICIWALLAKMHY